MQQTKGILRSKTFWSAAATIAGMLGAPFIPGVTFDADAGNVIINVHEVFTSAVGVATSIAIPGGVVGTILTRWIATKAVKGLF